MNVNDIYAKTKSLMFEKPSSTIYDNYLIANINRVLVELFEENNVERIWKGKPPLESYQIVTSEDEEVLYEDIYTELIIPLGLATYFLIDDDLSKYNLYNVDYQNARIRNQRLLSQSKLNGTTSDSTI